jgi:hypothetical protein
MTPLTPSPSDALARDAIGDHRACALKFRLVRHPMPLEEAAERFDRAFRLLMTAPPDDMSTPDGAGRVVDRHSCVYAARRFGHVVFRYEGHVVSLLVTADTAANEAAAGRVETAPHLIGRPMNGLSVMSVNGSRHAVLLVSDLGTAELTRLSGAVAAPLAEDLASGFIADDTLASLFLVPPAGR